MTPSHRALLVNSVDVQTADDARWVLIRNFVSRSPVSDLNQRGTLPEVLGSRCGLYIGTRSVFNRFRVA